MSEYLTAQGSACCLVSLFACFLAVPTQLRAQTVTVDAVLNNASYSLPGMPNAGIAQGSVFALFGANLAPDALWQASQFPLRTSTPSGTSIRVDVAGKSCDALPIYTTSRQVGAILPSDCPIGEGTVTLTYNGRSGAPASLRVVRSTFGVFAVNQQGSGGAVVQNFNAESDQPINSPDRPAAPGQTVILWGTGLGPIAAPDSGPPPVGNIPSAVTVWVGGAQAKVLYQGRSGCCAGIDQIILTVPEGIEGCHVPVVVETDGVTSNFTSIAVAAAGNPCRVAAWPRGVVLSGTRYGELLLFQSTLHSLQDTTNLYVEAIFARLDSTEALTGGTPPPGSCSVTSARLAQPSYNPLKNPLDVGGLTISGPMKGLLTKIDAGHYYDQASIPGNGFPPGTYTIDSPGGADVKAFQTSITIGAPLVWTNHADFEGAIARDRPLRVTWTASEAEGVMAISGGSAISSPQPGVVAEFLCMAPVAAGEFTVPPFVLGSLPASNNVGYLSVMRGVTKTFTAQGLDRALLAFQERAWTQSIHYQ